MAKNQFAKFKITPIKLVLLLLGLVGIYSLLPQLHSFNETLAVMRQATWFWVLLATVAALATFIVAAITQFAAGNSVGKFFDVVILQFAGAFVNHFLPFSLAGIGMTEEYYYRLGIKRPQAIVFVTIPVVFGVMTTAAIIIIVSPITLVQLSHSLRISARTRAIAIFICICAIAAILAFPLYKQRLTNALKQAKQGLKGITNIRQLIIVVAGSAGITLLGALALYLSVISVHSSISPVATIILYITSSLVTSAAPTPDGLGATEAALVFGLTRAGLDINQAVASTLFYRFITVWLPMIPGVFALKYIDDKQMLSR